MDGNPRTPSEISLNTPPEDEVASAEPDTVSAVLPPQRRRRLLKAISSKFSGVRRLRDFGSRHRARLIVAGAMSLVLGVFSCGFLTGWIVKEEVAVHRSEPRPTVVEIPVLDTQADSRVPDVRGMETAVAKQALADLDIDPNAVKIREVEWAGTPGVVVAQEPVGGEQVTGSLTLSVSKQASVPEVTGKKKKDAIDALQALGAEVTVTEQYSASATTGTVLSVSPQVGSPLDSSVQLVVAESGGSILLSSVNTAGSGSSCSTGTNISMNGTSYKEALACSGGYSSKESMYAWVLGRHASTFSTTVGLADSGKTDATATVRILADGNEVARADVAYGKPAKVNADVSNALRLEIAVSSKNGDTVYLGDALVKGTTAQIDQLEAEK
ncbi:PASTA domain-containing protein [Actinomyces oris]|jgi:PASTA domain|uniref:PASTA domain-containing protein n=1 Tax=Actinomyces oris TaxID=544580 RepID=A0AAE4G265_9ACTO|nr:PASTA domain-containing protein [Actinomyces oris]MDT0248133.1 PASTA domain-containing protein [Actinomyces oris]